MMVKKNIKIKWKKIIGPRQMFSLNQQILHGVCVFIGIALFCSIPLNFFINLPESGYLSIGEFILVSYIYYLSRIRNQYKKALVVFSFMIYIGILFTFLYNGGVEFGKVLMLNILLFVIILSVVEVKHVYYHIASYLIFTFTLILLEFFYPEIILQHYNTKLEKFIDYMFLYGVSLFLIYSIIISIRLNYIREKNLSDFRNKNLIKKNEELNDLVEVREVLFSTMVGGLLNSMVDLTNRVETLSNLPEDSDKKLVKNQLDEVKKCSRISKGVIQTLSEWTKNRKGEITLNRKMVELSSLLDSCIESLKFMANNKLITIKVRSVDKLVLSIDQYIFCVVISNLVENAIKYSHEGGEIIVSTKIKHNLLEVSVKDKGVGIEQYRLAKLFRIEYLKKHITLGTNGEQGTGLGLILCKELLEVYNGDIHVFSTINDGTVVVVNFPID